jgi:hypothetical protein
VAERTIGLRVSLTVSPWSRGTSTIGSSPSAAASANARVGGEHRRSENLAERGELAIVADREHEFALCGLE